MFLLMVFLSYQAGISMFTHTHTINGFVVVHSHLHNGDNHIHTDAQIFAISHVSAFLGEEAVIGSESHTWNPIITTIGREVEIFHDLSALVDGLNFRAPPVANS